MDPVAPSLPMPPQPAAPSFVPPAPTYPAPQPPAPRAPAPVGRPSGDPDIQEAKQERAQVRQRVKNLAPAIMTDGRFAIFRLKGARGTNKANGGRPVMQFLFKDIEKAMAEGRCTDTGEYIEEEMHAKFTNGGRFWCEMQDNRGRPHPDGAPYEINLDEEDLDELDDDELDELDDDEIPISDLPNKPMPPPPPAFDHAAFTRTTQELVREEKKGAQDMASLMMTMMASQASQQQQQMQWQMQLAEQRRAEEERRREREEREEREERKADIERLRIDADRKEKEEQRREDRERDRRKDEMQLMIQMMNRPDTTMPMLIKMIESKGDREGQKELFSMMGEAAKANIAAQGESNKVLMGAQAEAMKGMMGSVLGLSQTMMEQMVENQAEPTDDPMEKVGRMMKMFAPVIENMMKPTAQPVQVIPQPVQAVAQPRQRRPAHVVKPDVPPAERIKGALYTMMHLETGKIPVQQRFAAMKWCLDTLQGLPILGVIRSGQQDKIMEAGMEGMDNVLFTWISEPTHAEFLKDCLTDLQRILMGGFTESDAKASLQKHAAYLAAKNGGPQPLPESSEDIPADVDEEDVAQPVKKKPQPPPPVVPAAPAIVAETKPADKPEEA